MQYRAPSPAPSYHGFTALETECSTHSGKTAIVGRVAQRELVCDVAYLTSQVLLPPKGSEPRCEVHHDLSRQCQGLALPMFLSLSQHPSLAVLLQMQGTTSPDLVLEWPCTAPFTEYSKGVCYPCEHYRLVHQT